MKIDVKNWEYYKKSAKFRPSGRNVHVKMPAPGALYAVDLDGQRDVLIGYGTDIDVTLDDIYSLWATSEAWLYVELASAVASEGDILTNEDKRPNDSAIEASLKVALRRLQSEQAKMERERAAITRAAKVARGQVEPPEEPLAEPPSEPPVEAPAEPAVEPVASE